jgi:hypothetical protein
LDKDKFFTQPQTRVIPARIGPECKFAIWHQAIRIDISMLLGKNGNSLCTHHGDRPGSQPDRTPALILKFVSDYNERLAGTDLNCDGLL